MTDRRDDEDFCDDEFYDWSDDDDFESGRIHGIREGERRMLWAIAVGAHLDRDRLIGWMNVAGRSDYYRGVVQKLQEARDVALCTLRDGGDESALRLLGERGW